MLRGPRFEDSRQAWFWALELPLQHDAFLKRRRRCGGGWVLRRFGRGIVEARVIWHGDCVLLAADTDGDGFLGGGVLLPDALRRTIVPLKRQDSATVKSSHPRAKNP
jgi:hypothetical protein